MADVMRRDLERFRYWQGQGLRSRDFNDQARVAAQLRWWHNRAMHNIPGVLEGFAARLVGATRLVIDRGLAVDGFGREVILLEQVEQAVPSKIPASGLILLVRAGELFGSRNDPACLPGGDGRSGVASAARVEFIWQPANELDEHGAVRLGRLFMDASGAPLFEDQRSFGRPAARPRLASGSTIPGATDWELWSFTPDVENANSITVGLQVRIDTRPAGFTRTPCYFAWLQSEYDPQAHTTSDLIKDIPGLVVTEHIDETTVNGFLFRVTMLGAVLLARLGPRGGGGLFDVLSNQKPYVCWVGIETGPAG